MCCFETDKGKGLPLGNVTSQLFANIYLNELDQFIKHRLKQRNYIRYCDDFVIISPDEIASADILRYIAVYLRKELSLSLHPEKIEIRKFRQGIDFLGYVALPHRKVLRTRTKRRILSRVNAIHFSSYLGILKHARSFNVLQEMKKKIKQ